MKFPPELDSTMPDAVELMLKTRMVNDFLHSAYTLEQISEYDEVFFMTLGATRQALLPPPKKPVPQKKDKK
jgi:hypothetical protein